LHTCLGVGPSFLNLVSLGGDAYQSCSAHLGHNFPSAFPMDMMGLPFTLQGGRPPAVPPPGTWAFVAVEIEVWGEVHSLVSPEPVEPVAPVPLVPHRVTPRSGACGACGAREGFFDFEEEDLPERQAGWTKMHIRCRQRSGRSMVTCLQGLLLDDSLEFRRLKEACSACKGSSTPSSAEVILAGDQRRQARDHLVERGIVSADQISIMGW
jgi:translation initiation factor 1 (eIF-1/SUI1)